MSSLRTKFSTFSAFLFADALHMYRPFQRKPQTFATQTSGLGRRERIVECLTVLPLSLCASLLSICLNLW